MALSPGVEERVRVAVRVRPCAAPGAAAESPLVVPDSRCVRVKAKDHQFDRVFGPDASNADVYEYFEACVSSVTTGVHTTIFAYGPTGSGKTHTMLGHGLEDALKESCTDADSSSEDTFGALELKRDGLGIIPRAVTDLFRRLENASAPQRYAVHMAYIQIYNERIYDLLADPRREHALQIREGAGGAVYVQGLTEVRCGTAEEILTLLVAGGRHRARRETAGNKVSSRSHAIVTLSVEIETAAERTVLRRALLNLVDLAGSEKWGDRYDMDDAETKELLSINTSLSALGNCIKALQEKGRQHVPFRDSTLTRLLQDSLAGGGRTAVLGCISEDAQSLEDSISTLQFASRASCVTCKVRTNEVVSDTVLLKRALKEIERLRKKLAIEDGTDGQKLIEDDQPRALARDLGKKLLLLESSLEAEKAKNAVLVKKIEELMQHVPEASLLPDGQGLHTSTTAVFIDGESVLGQTEDYGCLGHESANLRMQTGRSSVEESTTDPMPKGALDVHSGSAELLEHQDRTTKKDLPDKKVFESPSVSASELALASASLDDQFESAVADVNHDCYSSENPETDSTSVPTGRKQETKPLSESSAETDVALSSIAELHTGLPGVNGSALGDVCASHGLKHCFLCPMQASKQIQKEPSTRLSPSSEQLKNERDGRCMRHNLEKCVLCLGTSITTLPEQENESPEIEAPVAPCARHHLRKCLLCVVSKSPYSIRSPNLLEAARWRDPTLSVSSSMLPSASPFNSQAMQSKSLQSLHSAFSFGSPNSSAFTPKLEHAVEVDFETLARQSKEYVTKSRNSDASAKDVQRVHPSHPIQKKAIKKSSKVRQSVPCEKLRLRVS